MTETNQTEETKPRYFTPVSGVYVGKIKCCEVRVYREGQFNESRKYRFTYVPKNLRVKNGKWEKTGYENPALIFEVWINKDKPHDTAERRINELKKIAGVTGDLQPVDSVVEHLNGGSHQGKVIKIGRAHV